MKNKSASLPVPDTRASLNRRRGYNPLERCWFVTRAGLMIRMLVFTDYSPCENGGLPREFELRLQPDDPRPIGRRVHYGKHWQDERYNRSLARWYAQMEFGVWYAPPDEPRPVPAYHDHTALALIPTAALVLRGESAA